MGYHRAGFEVVGVDNKPQPHYPFEFILGDALHIMDNLLRGAPLFRKEGDYYLSDFDAYHASPPCQAYVRMRHLPWLKDKKYPMLIDAVREKLKATDKTWVIENVKPYYEPLIKAQGCGRHVFWANFFISKKRIDYDIGTMNRQASKISQRKAIIREAQIPELTDLHGFNLDRFSLPNKRQVLRNTVLPELGLHIFKMAFKDQQETL
ncbi:hypothetical protein LCGC14_3145260 [marine sediment metagenome]|uniref:DNA (cytosine-5-)-methyltransferase n=1 Tax=marine sediment metagenome TaxID=412755 RepID=A0A0F8VVN8_9ZZZZ